MRLVLFGLVVALAAGCQWATNVPTARSARPGVVASTSPSPSPSPSPPPPVSVFRANRRDVPPVADIARSRCAPHRLQASLSQRISERTQQETLGVILTNIGRSPCRIGPGYPYIGLATAGHRLDPFRFAHHGDQEITNRQPTPVSLAAGGHAFVAINKNTCVARDHRIVRWLYIGFAPDVSIHIQLPRDPEIGYCPNGDPGHHVEVSPVTSRYQRAFHFD